MEISERKLLVGGGYLSSTNYSSRLSRLGWKAEGREREATKQPMRNYSTYCCVMLNFEL